MIDELQFVADVVEPSDLFHFFTVMGMQARVDSQSLLTALMQKIGRAHV